MVKRKRGRGRGRPRKNAVAAPTQDEIDDSPTPSESAALTTDESGALRDPESAIIASSPDQSNSPPLPIVLQDDQQQQDVSTAAVSALVVEPLEFKPRRNPKNFGKFRYLHDSANRSNESSDVDDVTYSTDDGGAENANTTKQSEPALAASDIKQHEVMSDVSQVVDIIDYCASEVVSEVVDEPSSVHASESTFTRHVDEDVLDYCADTVVHNISDEVIVIDNEDQMEVVEEVEYQDASEEMVVLSELGNIDDESSMTGKETVIEECIVMDNIEYDTAVLDVQSSPTQVVDVREAVTDNANEDELEELQKSMESETNIEIPTSESPLEHVIQVLHNDSNEEKAEQITEEVVENMSDLTITAPPETCESIEEIAAAVLQNEPIMQRTMDTSDTLTTENDDHCVDESKTTEPKPVENVETEGKAPKKRNRARKKPIEADIVEEEPPVSNLPSEAGSTDTSVCFPDKEMAMKDVPFDSAFMKALELADKAPMKTVKKKKPSAKSAATTATDAAPTTKGAAKTKKSTKASEKGTKKLITKAMRKQIDPFSPPKKTKDEEDDSSVRRSSRIQTITNLKKSSKSKGKGLVTKAILGSASHGSSAEVLSEPTSDNSNSTDSGDKHQHPSTISFGTPLSSAATTPSSVESPTFASPNVVLPANDVEGSKPVKVKSRWRRSSELEMNISSSGTNSATASPLTLSRSSSITDSITALPVEESAQPSPEQVAVDKAEVDRRLRQFIHLKENQYLTERISCKEAKKMTCDCFLTEDEREGGEFGCGEDCLNRLLMIECGQYCAVGDRCTNKRFQKGQFAPVEVFNTNKKGLGIRAAANIPYGEFVLEYVGEVLNPDEFDKRATDYSQDKNRHYYFMALRADAIIDATQKGNISRFINHSCDPNAETQKWTVNGELRIGFFSKRTILAGEEITFDYQFQRYGKEAQKCYCEASTCRGWLGQEPEDEDFDEEDEEEDEEEEKPDIDKELIDVKSDFKKELNKKPADVTKKLVRKEPKPRKERAVRKPRKEFFEDLDLDAEIEQLQTTGLKNQAHTLKLSRLMVRAKEPAQRTKLLRVLRRGDFPCRRLFLDYHGLRLIHGWMTDAQQLAKQDKRLESMRLEILQTVATLPIPNKSMLQDSKVLPTVEKWAIADKDAGDSSPVESESNSPKDDESEKLSKLTESSTVGEAAPKEKLPDVEASIVTAVTKMETTEIVPKSAEVVPKTEASEDAIMEGEECIENIRKNILESEVESSNSQSSVIENELENIRKSVGFVSFVSAKIEPPCYERSLAEQLASMFSDEDSTESKADLMESKPEVREVIAPSKSIVASAPPVPIVPAEPDYITEIVALAQKLLEEWSTLKEVFRIPKKERIEQMKEHEREANKTFSAQSSSSHRSLSPDRDPYERRDRSRYSGKSKYDFNDRYRKDDRDRNDRGGSSSYSSHSGSYRMTKFERRKMFAIQVEQEETERRKHRDMWLQHEKQCMLLGTDPRFTAPFDPSRGYHCIWNPQLGQWQNYPIQDSNYVRHGPPAPHPYPYPMPPPLAAPPPPNPNMTGPMPPMAGIQPYPQEIASVAEDPAKVKFMGPIPPPVQLPPKWKCAKDKYGRPYYYHIRVRKAQWEPPDLHALGNTEAAESSSTTSSSDTSSLSSSSSTENSDSEEDDTKLLIGIRTKFRLEEAQRRLEQLKAKDKTTPLVTVCKDSEVENTGNVTPIQVLESGATLSGSVDEIGKSSLHSEPVEDLDATAAMLEKRLKHETDSPTPSKKRRTGLVQEFIISPRTEQDRIQFKEDIKKYKENKEMLRKQKERILEQSKKRAKMLQRQSTSTDTDKTSTPSASTAVEKVATVSRKKSSSSKHKVREGRESADSDEKRRIKESFRSAMATVMVAILNPFRKSDCREGKITNTEDFKHLARKLTHFVMVKELKHCQKIEDLQCTESVKAKAKEFVRKYMSKFGETYIRPKDDLDSYF